MSKQTTDRLDDMERRLAQLELPRRMASRQAAKPGWLALAGWAKGDALHEKAARLGAALRKTS